MRNLSFAITITFILLGVNVLKTNAQESQRRLMEVEQTAPLSAQARPDFSGVWRLIPAESQMIGGGGEPDNAYQLTWLVKHREPEMAVAVNVRNAQGSAEFSFRCTTDGVECVNELTSLREVRRMTAAWDGDTLVMSQRASTPHGGFDARDRLLLTAAGERLVFQRVVTNEQGDRSVRMVFRKLGPHPSQRPPPEPLTSVALPSELERVLREYERHWRGGNAEALAALFTEDGFVARRGGWIRGQAGLRDALQRTSSDLRLRAVAYSIDEHVGYIIGAYGYGDQAGVPDRGMFILTLRRGAEGRWLIAADLDGAIRP
ncbi:MAG TPA: nuclear transport factor 2 family protein [Aridibacter sp.]|nr:nuclear transport factor 2 family protein [Aridibacter sp.]